MGTDQLKRQPSPRSIVGKIVSGGQTGADRAALDAAMAVGMPHGGWVPLGRRAEDGPISRRYRLRQTRSYNPAVRTRWNVRDSDATLIFSHGPLTGGSALTLTFAQRLGKPVLHVDFSRDTNSAARRRITRWLLRHRPKVLNIAGPRASSDPVIYDCVYRMLVGLFTPKEAEAR